MYLYYLSSMISTSRTVLQACDSTQNILWHFAWREAVGCMVSRGGGGVGVLS